MQHRRKRAGLLKSALLGAATLGAISLAGAGVAQAAPIVWNFNNPTGKLGVTQVYTSNPTLSPAVNITASGFSRNSATNITLTGTTVNNTGTVALYGKSSGTTEQGVGLTNDPATSQNEISTSGFIQLDLTNLTAAYKSTPPRLSSINMSFSANSVQTASNDVWYVFGSNSAGHFSTSNAIAHGSDASQVTLNNILGIYDFLDVTTASGNVLITEVDNSTPNPTNTPEPGSLALLGTGLLGLGLVARRRRRKA